MLWYFPSVIALIIVWRSCMILNSMNIGIQRIIGVMKTITIDEVFLVSIFMIELLLFVLFSLCFIKINIYWLHLYWIKNNINWLHLSISLHNIYWLCYIRFSFSWILLGSLIIMKIRFFLYFFIAKSIILIIFIDWIKHLVWNDRFALISHFFWSERNKLMIVYINIISVLRI